MTGSKMGAVKTDYVVNNVSKFLYLIKYFASIANTTIHNTKLNAYFTKFF